MANVIRDEDLRLNLIINGSNANLKEIGDQEHAIRKLNNETKDLRLVKAELLRDNKKGTPEWERVTAAIKKNGVAVKGHEAELKKLKVGVGLTGMTMRQLTKEAQDLRYALNNTVPGTADYKKYQAALRAVDRQIAKVKGTAGGIKNSLSKMSNGFNKYFGMMAAGSAAIFGLVASGKELITGNAKLSDSYADVAKTTGLTIAEVKDLAKNLKQIDTRTSKAELLSLAEMAGKLGVTGKKNIEGFVKSADQINVALGKDLGGNAEEAIKQVGKLVDIFEVKDEFGLNEGMLKVGSTINALGAASTANEGYIVEFGKRMAGIAPAADISIESILGLGATLDSLGQTSEVSSTVFTQLIPKMFKDTATSAEVAGMKTKDFADLLEEDANEAMVRFLEGLGGNNAGLKEMSTKLAKMGFAGKKSISVLGVLAKNTDKLREQQTLANKSFEEGTSLTQEFNLKNTNLAATLEKISKRLKGMFVNSAVTEGLKNMVGHIERWTRTNLSETLNEERKSVLDLQIQINDSNITVEERKKLLEKLKEINPDITKGVNDEAGSYVQLNKNIAEYNEHMIDRIMLQKKQEEIDEYKEVHVDGRREELAEARIHLRETITEYYDNLNKIGGETAKKAQDIMAQSTYDNGNEITKAGKLVMLQSLAAQNDISKYASVEARHRLSEAEKWLADFEKTLSNMEEKRNALKKELGVGENIEAISPNGPTGGTPTGGTPTGGTPTGGTPTGNEDELTEAEKTEKEKLKLRQEWEKRQLGISDLYAKKGNKNLLNYYVDYLTDRKTKDTDFLDYYKVLKAEEQQTVLEIAQQTLEIEALERETAYIEELNAVGDNEEEKANITRRYRLKEIELQKEAINTALNETQQALENVKDTEEPLSLFEEKEVSNLLLQIAELKKELAELDGKETNINISTNSSGQKDDYKSKTQKVKGVFGGQSIAEEEGDKMAALQAQHDAELIGEQEFLDTKQAIEDDANAKRLAAYGQVADSIGNIMGNVFDLQNQRSQQANAREIADLNETAKAKIAALTKEAGLDQLSGDAKIKAEKKLKIDIAAVNQEFVDAQNKILKQQFETEKKQKLASATMSIASAILMALASAPPPYNFVLAGLSAVAGAAQMIAIDESQFTPQAKDGGYQNVIGEDDKKQYRAKRQKQTGGYFPEPTLLVGENPEYVIPNEGLENPTIASMLPVIEEARTSGTLRDITPEALFGTTTYSAQKATGGYTSDISSDSGESSNTDVAENQSSSKDDAMIFAELSNSINRLNGNLENGIWAKLDQRAVYDVSVAIDEQKDIESRVTA